MADAPRSIQAALASARKAVASSAAHVSALQQAIASAEEAHQHLAELVQHLEAADEADRTWIEEQLRSILTVAQA